MKMHSYMSTNGYLQRVNRNFEKKMEVLRSATSRVGGWDTALTEARAASSEKPSGTNTDELGHSPSITPLGDGTRRGYIDGDMAITLRDRLLAVPETSGESTETVDNNLPQGNGVQKSTAPRDNYKDLVFHPDPEISTLANEMLEMDMELTSSGPGKVRYPHNITWKIFAEYMLIPTLVYELEYPRTEK